jgi:NADPH-dependent curcumin reductase CurA
MIYTCQRIQGFLAGPYLKEGKFLQDMDKWVLQDKLITVHETFFDGIEQWPAAFVSVMNGSHTGKVVVRLAK